MKNSTDDS